MFHFGPCADGGSWCTNSSRSGPQTCRIGPASLASVSRTVQTGASFCRTAPGPADAGFPPSVEKANLIGLGLLTSSTGAVGVSPEIYDGTYNYKTPVFSD